MMEESAMLTAKAYQGWRTMLLYLEANWQKIERPEDKRILSKLFEKHAVEGDLMEIKPSTFRRVASLYKQAGGNQ